MLISRSSFTDKKENKFSSYKRKFRVEQLQSHIQYELRNEMRKYFPIYEEAVSHIWLCNWSTLNFLIYEENFIFFFISVLCERPNPVWTFFPATFPPPLPVWAGVTTTVERVLYLFAGAELLRATTSDKHINQNKNISQSTTVNQYFAYFRSQSLSALFSIRNC
jgi:hypothetical protein